LRRFAYTLLAERLIEFRILGKPRLADFAGRQVIADALRFLVAKRRIVPGGKCIFGYTQRAHII
jgi:hypothetical protein